MVLVCLLHARIQEFSPRGGGGGGGDEGGPGPPDRKKLLCLKKKNADSFTEGSDFFLFDSLRPINNLSVI